MAFLISTVIAMFLLAPSVFAQEVQNIVLHPTPQPDGSLSIDVTWDPPADVHDILHYRIYQIQGSRGGVSAPQILPASTSALRITDVPADDLFGVSIQVVWNDGHTSHGAFASIGDAPPLPLSPLIASVTSPGAPAAGLSRADLGMVLFVIIAGAVVGTLSVRLFHRA